MGPKIGNAIVCFGAMRFFVFFSFSSSPLSQSLKIHIQIEYILVHVNEKTKEAKLLLRGDDLLKYLMKEEQEHPE
jgi:hypothetical protein